MATIASPSTESRSAERRFYSRMALFLVFVVFAGFAPSFYLKDIVPPYPRPNPTLPVSVILHGLLFTLWMFVFIAQTQLVAAGRRDIHMKLGTASMFLAIAMLPMMYIIAVWQVARANQPPFTDPLTWTILPLITIPAFSILIWQGWSRRRNAQWHKRIMLSAAILIMMGPSIGRLPIAPPTLIGTTILLVLGWALFIPLFIWDRRSQGHVHPATWLGFGVVAVATLIPVAVFWTGADWASVAARLPGVGS